MSVGVSSFRGARLKEARLARGLYKSTLADLVGISGTAITRYEDGEDKPQRDRLDALATHLRFPVEFFSKPEWPEELPIVFWRTQASESKHAREMTEQRMKWVCEIFSFFESEVNFPSLNLPCVDLPSDIWQITPAMIEGAADSVREQWKLGDHPIPDVVLALENAGIPVITLNIPSDKQDGFCFRTPMLNRVFVGINTYEVSCVRARYDAAHELGHAILHGFVTPQQARDPKAHKRIEQQAHRFAGAFLFPRSSFRREVAVPSLDYFSSLKRRWGMSIAAMVYRAFDLGLVDQEERQVLYRNMARRKWRGPLQEPFDNELPLERPRMLRRGLEVMLSESAYERSGLRIALALPDRELEQIIALEDGYFNGGEFTRLATSKRPPVAAVDMESGKIVEFPRRSRST